MLIKVIILILLASLNWARGYHWRPISIAIMSILTGLYFAITLKVWWLLFICGVPMAVCLGLGDKNRGIWGLLVALGASFALLLTHYLVWWLFLPYLGLNYFLGWLMVNKLKAKQLWADLVTGAGFGVIVFLC